MTLSPRILRFAVLCACGITVPAAAQSIRFSGSTTGCFFVSTPCTPKSTDLISTLQFEGGSFDATTVNGKFQFGTASNNFGLFSLGGKPTIYDGLSFLLDINFTRPLVSGPDALFNAAITGRVRPKPVGGDIYVNFGPPQQLNFRGGGTGGFFGLGVNDMTVKAGTGHQPIGGSIDATTTPEPATITLVATGLAALIPAARRRRKKNLG